MFETLAGADSGKEAMRFTYQSYEELVRLILNSGYRFGLFEENIEDNVVLMRHDIDICLEKALSMARLENRLGIQSTYFIWVSGLYYNIFHHRSRALIREIAHLGHDIGLHFDSSKYGMLDNSGIETMIDVEKNALSSISNDEFTIRSISEHIPSRNRLGGRPIHGGMLDAYSSSYFSDIKYLSDSDMNWREDVFSIVKERAHSRIQLLTHPIWYNESILSKEEILSNFVSRRIAEYHEYLGILCKSNIPKLEDLVNERCWNINRRNREISPR